MKLSDFLKSKPIRLILIIFLSLLIIIILALWGIGIFVDRTIVIYPSSPKTTIDFMRQTSCFCGLTMIVLVLLIYSLYPSRKPSPSQPIVYQDNTKKLTDEQKEPLHKLVKYDIESLRQQLAQHRSNLNKLKEQEATYGLGERPLSLLNRIDYEQKTIEELEIKIRNDNPSNTD